MALGGRERRSVRIKIGVGLALQMAIGFQLPSALAQPPLGQMSGIPLPDAELPDGTVTVRVVRGQVANNVSDHVVELQQGDGLVTAFTDLNGRATFSTLNPGTQVQAFTDLDGRRLQSQEFAVPARGGVRIMLAGANSEPPGGPAQSGDVTFGSDSWIQVEIVEESVEVYFFLEVVNPSSDPVEPSAAVAFDLPDDAQGVTVLRSSTPRAVADGPRIEVPGPFQSGTTSVHFAYVLPYKGETLVISQLLPADLDSLLVFVENWGGVDFVSAQVERRMEVPADGPDSTPYILGGGPMIPAGETWRIELTGLPHRNTLPSSVAIVMALGIFGFGIWGAITPPEAPAAARHRRILESRKEKLFGDLVKIEGRYSAGKIGSTKYGSRRRELVTALEQVYRDLDEQLRSVLLTSDPNIERLPGEGHPGTAS